jgi:membrane protease YdiL (CAAX protease family)
VLEVLLREGESLVWPIFLLPGKRFPHAPLSISWDTGGVSPTSSTTLPRFMPPQRVRAWRWIVGTVVILGSWLVGGTLLGLGLLPYTGVDPQVLLTGGDVLAAMPAWGYLFFALITFLPLFVGTLVAYRFVLGVKVRFLFSTFDNFRWWRVALGFWVWVALIGGPVIVGIVLSPEAYSFSPTWETFLPFLLVGLLLLPMQTTAEELLFRGWIIQWAAQASGNIWWLSTLSGTLFSLPHLLNPEAAGDTLGAFFGYFTVGFALAWVTVRDRSLEIAIGAHMSNNLFAALVVGYEGGVLPAEALFVTEPIEWGASNLVGVLVIPLFVLLTRPGRPRAKAIPDAAS